MSKTERHDVECPGCGKEFQVDPFPCPRCADPIRGLKNAREIIRNLYGSIGDFIWRDYTAERFHASDDDGEAKRRVEAARAYLENRMSCATCGKSTDTRANGVPVCPEHDPLIAQQPQGDPLEAKSATTAKGCGGSGLLCDFPGSQPHDHDDGCRCLGCDDCQGRKE